MQRFFAGTLELRVRLTPQGPWIVRGETRERRQSGEGRVLMPLKDARGQVLLPASSLKGVLRSTSERILRTLDTGADPERPPLADSPFPRSNEQLAQLIGRSAPPELQHDKAQARRWLLARLPRAQVSDAELAERAGWERPPPDVYRQLSATSQLFGSTLHTGLLSLDDAMVPASGRERSHVAIDRFTGGVGEGPFTEELSIGADPLETTLRVECFALWHLALLALTLRELDSGYAAIGGGTRKGQGRVKAEVLSVSARYAEQVYREAGITGGLISAQAWLHYATEGRAWHRDDTPPAVLTAEGRGQDRRPLAVLLPDLTPLDEGEKDWRRAGTLKISVPQARVAELFRAAVAGPWRSWLETRVEKGGPHG